MDFIHLSRSSVRVSPPQGLPAQLLKMHSPDTCVATCFHDIIIFTPCSPEARAAARRSFSSGRVLDLHLMVFSFVFPVMRPLLHFHLAY